ncbi:MAG TPA: hypothetical protein VKQ30_13355 [Ktedonobacterales bacterium]|nr:hypothetical protein [Ktedonobacterales bacterium]
MTQADLAIRLHQIWKDTHEEDWPFDSSWVGKLERGHVLVDGALANCVTEALGATRDERTLLMAAVGFNTVPEDVLDDLQIPVHDIPISLSVHMDTVLKDKGALLEDLLHVVHQIKDIVRDEILRKVRDAESLDGE